MPAYSSYLLQPLDIGYFSVLKRAYSTAVQNRIRLGFDHIDKAEFLTAYPSARQIAFTPETIQNSFAATSLVLYNPIRVLSKLDIYILSSYRLGSRNSDQSSDSALKTPKNIRQLNQ